MTNKEYLNTLILMNKLNTSKIDKAKCDLIASNDVSIKDLFNSVVDSDDEIKEDIISLMGDIIQWSDNSIQIENLYKATENTCRAYIKNIDGNIQLLWALKNIALKMGWFLNDNTYKGIIKENKIVIPNGGKIKIKGIKDKISVTELDRLLIQYEEYDGLVILKDNKIIKYKIIYDIIKDIDKFGIMNIDLIITTVRYSMDILMKLKSMEI